MKKSLLIFVLFLLLFLTDTKNIHAEERASASSAKIQTTLILKENDQRVKILESYLKKYNSPLAENADDFVRYADRYDLDWKFVAAIAGLESTFGHQIPNNSYNAWGWGIYGNNVIRFNSWEEGIEAISEGLRVKYMDKWGAQDIYQIGRIYASSPTWAERVNYFMNNIQDFALRNPKNSLSLSI